jgi:hypothetical protein
MNKILLLYTIFFYSFLKIFNECLSSLNLLDLYSNELGLQNRILSD